MTGKLFAGNLSIDFFDEKEFEPLDELYGDEKNRANARNLIRLLMLEQVVGWRQSINLQTLRFAFFDASHSERGFMLEALQEGLTRIGQQLQEKTLDEFQLEQADILINSILCYLPFAYPQLETKFSVPQMIQGQWQMVPYNIVPIELTAKRRNIPFIFNNQDRVWAYGLKPQVDSLDVSPWLVYHGTTYPSGDGFITQVMSDIKPFQTVGHDLFESGLEEIEEWFDLHPRQKMKVTGVSLGGSLSLLTACKFGDKCDVITALNPAGLVENSRLANIDRWDDFEDKSTVKIVTQGADPVSIFGSWKPDWIFLRGDVSEDCPNLFTHHFVNFAGSRHTKFIHEPVDNDKKMRQINNFVFYTAARAVSYTCLLLPWRYILIPLYRLAKAILFATFALISALMSAVIDFVIKVATEVLRGISMLVNGLINSAFHLRETLWPETNSVDSSHDYELDEFESSLTLV